MLLYCLYIPTGFNLESFKDKLKKTYEKQLNCITNLPWNEEWQDKRNLEDIYVELELEQAQSDDQKRQKVGQETKGNRVIQNEDLVKLKCKTDTDGFAKRVAIKGEVGSGKSCLLGKLAYDWSQGKALNEFELVFLLRLSEIEKGTSLFDAIDQQIYDFANLKKDNFKMYIKQNSNNLLFLMDSWDETLINHKCKNTCVGSDDVMTEAILSNKSLLTSCVLLTTRPHKPVPSMYVAVNLKGFSPHNVNLYIKRFFGDSKNAESVNSDSENANSLSSGLINKLKQSDLLKAICHIPVILMLLCTTWKDKNNFSDTISGLYEEFMQTIWERFCIKPNNEGKKEYHDQVKQFLGHNALSGLLSKKLEDKVEFHESDLKVPSNLCELGSSELCEIGLGVGLIIKQRWQLRTREKLIISFLHKSFQEYYTGKRLAYLFKNKRTKFNQKLSLITNWELVLNKLEILKFCCGISGNQQETAAVDIIDHVIKKYDKVCQTKNMFANKEELCRGDNEHHVHVESYIDVGDIHPFGSKHDNATDCLPILTLLHEAQLKGNTTLSSLFSGPVFSKPMSVEIDCWASQALMLFNYFLQSVSKAAANIKSIRFCAADSLDLIQDILRHVLHVENLNFEGPVTGAVGESVAALTHLSTLKLYRTGIDMTDLLSHLPTYPCMSLRHVDFTHTPIGDAISHIGAVMTTYLTCLVLDDTHLSESHIEILSKHLPNAPHLQVLDLSHNAIGGSISVLTQHLQHCTAMQALRLQRIKLHHNHKETLIAFFSSWSVDLLELDLSHSAVGGNGTELSNYLQHCRQMEVLNLEGIWMNEKDIEAISVVLPQTLLKLILAYNVVVDSLTCLIRSLQHCEQLTWLDLQSTYLTDAGVVTLGQHLHHWCHLSVLVLYDNDVGNSGLHSVLTHIHHLSKLTFFTISAYIDSSCSDLVRDCVHALGKEIREGGGWIEIGAHRKEQIQSILNLSKAASQAE